MIKIRREHVFISVALSLIFSSSLLYPHGFYKDTIIYCNAGNTIQTLEHITERVKKNKRKYVTSYDQRTHQYVEKRVRAAGFSQVPYCCALSFNDEPIANIMCSPTQHFYRLSDRKWVAAQDLAKSDNLLAQTNGFVRVSDITIIQESFIAYTIEVEDTHTFLVGPQGIVAHNIIIPAITAGISIPFGCGGGAAAGSFLGPIGIIGGIVFGGLVGIAIKTCKRHNADTEYNISFRPDAVSVFMNEHNTTPTKTVEDILSDAKPGRKTSGKTKQYEKEGTYNDALKDFESLGATGIKNIENGMRGILPDGRDVNVRTESSFKTPTLEIYDSKTERSIKIRYTGRKG